MNNNRAALTDTPARETAFACIEAGIDAAHPDCVLESRVALDGSLFHVADSTHDLDEFERVVVLGAGNAAGGLARGLETILGESLSGGAVVTDDPTETDCIEVFEGDHPVPSERAVVGARRVLELADAADEQTLVLAVLTGGGSALLPGPVEDVSLDDLQLVTRKLLDSGAAIEDINAVRKHFSRTKGGELARVAAPATVVGLLVSDVVGDRLDAIASGPTVPDPTTFEDALCVLSRYDIDAPLSVHERLERGTRGETAETPTAENEIFDRVENHVLAGADTAIDAAREVAEKRGYRTLCLSSRIRGEARDAVLTHVAVAEECLATGQPVEPPAVVVSGGETTVTVRGDGRGGPNQEFALAAAIEFTGAMALASIDTDGRDGGTDIAGAIVDSDTVEADDREAANEALADNDSAGFLGGRDALIRTGRTGTNVNDLRILVIEDTE
jgi:glycerate 2-kinase